MFFKRLHQGKNDKYFLLADTAWRSLSRFGINILIAKLAGADAFSLLVLLLTAEVIVTTLLSAWHVMPALNTGSGTTRDERNSLGRHILVGSARWASLLAGVAAIAWGLTGFAGAGAALASGLIVMVWTACLLQAIRAWRSINFESWHVFWADLIALGLPLLLMGATYWLDGPDRLLVVWAWGSSLAACVSAWMMLGSGRRDILTAPPLKTTCAKRLSRQSVPLVAGSLANTLGARAHPMLLAALAASIEVARFGAVLTLVGPLRMLGMAMSGVVRPRLALAYNRSDIAMARQLMTKACLLVLMTAATMATGVVWAGDWLANLLFGDWLTTARPLLLVGLAYGTVACVASFVVTAIQTQSDDGPAYTARLRIIASAVMLLMGAAGATMMGAMGTLLALCFTETVYLILATRHWWAIDAQEATTPNAA